MLFDELGLPVIKKTKTGPSTDASVLEELARQHPLPAKIIEYRQYAKLKGTYVDALPQMVHPETGRVHASFNQVVAATGRLSSSDPNLQNIPIRTEAGREIRSAFVPAGPGWKLLAADYSQIELRVLAHFSDDETLCEAFAAGRGHPRPGGQPGERRRPGRGDQRRCAAAPRRSISASSTAKARSGWPSHSGISKDEAARFIDEYFARYPGVEDFMQRTLADCRRDGLCEDAAGAAAGDCRRAGPQQAKGGSVRRQSGAHAAQLARANRRQHGDPRHGGRLDQARDARSLSPNACREPGVEDDPANP